MLKILNKDTQDTLEKKAREGVGALTEGELAEKMAHAFCMQYRRDFNTYGGERIVVFAGPGTIGAVAMLVANIFHGIGYAVEVVLLNPTGTLSPLINTLYSRLQDAGVPLMMVTSDFRPPKMGEETIVIDGICGLELAEGPFTGPLAAVCRYINSKKPLVIALDIPSGLHAEGGESGSNPQTIIQAKHTYTYHGPKLSFFFKENARYVGEWHLLNVGIDDGKADKAVHHYLAGYSDMEGIIPTRSRFTHKYDYGRVLLVAGSKGMIGAALLAAKAAYRSGVGHLTIVVPDESECIVHSTLPEALVATGGLPKDLSIFDAIAVGPGLGRDERAKELVERILVEYKGRLIIDADALYLLATYPELMEIVPEETILTPHIGEFDTLFGPFNNSKVRLEKALEIAKARRLYIVLKGAYTATITPVAPIVFNSTGNAGMATAGTGDVLTGMILGAVGKRVSHFEACLTSVFLHGYAGDLYAADNQCESLMASDIIDYLPKAFRAFSVEHDLPLI